MLSKRDGQFGRRRPVAPDTFIRGNDPKDALMARVWPDRLEQRRQT
jgi:hypothetical protein